MIKSDDTHRFLVSPTEVTGNETGIDNPFLRTSLLLTGSYYLPPIGDDLWRYGQKPHIPDVLLPVGTPRDEVAHLIRGQGY